MFWGSPLSTGLDSIDYFLTGELFLSPPLSSPSSASPPPHLPPPVDAFTEQPVALSGLGAFLFPPAVAEQYTSRVMKGSDEGLKRELFSRFGIPTHHQILFCPQVRTCA